MCGISGIFSFNNEANLYTEKTKKSIELLKHRGPNAIGFYSDQNVSLGHSRLSIIDLNAHSNQPFTDLSGRYTIIFNGEIFNYKQLSIQLTNVNIVLHTNSDTEVLLHLYIKYKKKCLEFLEGFFAFAIYDNQTEEVFIARDRFGVKPLVYYVDQNKIIFASEIKALLAYNLKKNIDKIALYQYLQLNYIVAPRTIFQDIQKLMPGHFMVINKNNFEIVQYYIPNAIQPTQICNYTDACKNVANILENAVVKRLISDVPIGVFLSGGLDSSIITALATRHSKLQTFSLGFKGENLFNETNYATLASKAFGTQHTIIELTTDDVENEIFNILNYLDEPFGDSSLIAYYILSKKTAPLIKVALTGDGADEVFGGYNKHMAEARVRNPTFSESILKYANPYLEHLPSSRHNYMGNKIRQLQKYSSSINMTSKERYWKWCSFANENDALNLMQHNLLSYEELEKYQQDKNYVLRNFTKTNDLNEVLVTDVALVLANDMLPKVDWATMINGQEARNPFLDHHVVELAFFLPAEYKITTNNRKKILYDTFREILPIELLQRSKHGFEIPVRNIIINTMGKIINEKLLNSEFITQQGLFNHLEINRLVRKFYSKNPGDTHARIWGLIVFQIWWENYYK